MNIWHAPAEAAAIPTRRKDHSSWDASEREKNLSPLGHHSASSRTDPDILSDICGRYTASGAYARATCVGMNENLGFRPQLTAAATLLHLLADSLQCGTEEKCVLELRRISIRLQDKKSLAALPDAQARPALARRGARVRRLACSRSCRWRSLRAFLARPRAAAALAPLFALPLVRGLCKT